jgi:hypothetical protein
MRDHRSKPGVQSWWNELWGAMLARLPVYTGVGFAFSGQVQAISIVIVARKKKGSDPKGLHE